MRPTKGAHVGVWATLAALLLACGCPRAAGTPTGTSGAARGDVWVVFQVVEKGTGSPLQCFVWAQDHQADFETVDSRAQDEVGFHGLGQAGDGYAVAFRRRHTVRLYAWAPEHELAWVEQRLERGENRVVFELRKVEVEDQRVPEEIRIEVPRILPKEGARTGT